MRDERSRRNSTGISLVVGAIPLVCLALASQMAARSAQTVPTPDLNTTVRPFFATNCIRCHNNENSTAGLNLEALRGPDTFVKDGAVWENIVQKIRSGQMPPSGSPRPDATQAKSVTDFIESEFDHAQQHLPPDPGRVTARRLNRTEYNNTVRDLLGVDLEPANDFPQDDSGYGFDNNGDVLSLSSSQMEKYMTAAEKIARTAIFGPEPLQPTLVKVEAARQRIESVTTVPVHYDPTGLDLPNSLHATHRFPVDGEYLFRFHLDGVRPLGSESVRFGLWIDGKKVQTIDFDPTGNAAFSPDRQDFSGRTVEFRPHIVAGDHWVAATIERMYEGLPAQYGGPNPSKKQIQPAVFKVPPGFPPERIEAFRKRFEARQKELSPTNDVRVSRLEIGGPYAQAKGPSEESLRKIFVCGHLHGGHTAACTREIIGALARRAFRRPVSPQEVDRLASLVSMAQKQGDSYDEGICLAVQAILVSPNFLYRIERDPPTAKPNTGHLISQYALATRLSYFLWSTMPDAELRRCADHQLLRKPEVLRAQVERMLKDPRSHALAENFAGQWLQFRALESAKPDRERFPEFDEYLRMSMREETERFFDSVVHDDRSIFDLLVGKYTFVNERLADFYGIPGVVGPEFRRVDLTGTPRGGILTQGSVLTVSSYANRTSPVLRGKWILENVLNTPPPPPPPNVPNLDVAAVGTAVSLRQQLEEHRKNPTCASCHSRMDPLGFGLENFDAVGAWRTQDGKLPIDASGSLPDGRNFRGPDGLKLILMADHDAFARCLTEKLLTYALGRGLESYDRSTVKDITQRIAANNYHFSNLILEIVTSRPFQMRKGNRFT